jgi:hypothetical protein
MGAKSVDVPDHHDKPHQSRRMVGNYEADETNQPWQPASSSPIRDADSRRTLWILVSAAIALAWLVTSRSEQEPTDATP